MCIASGRRNPRDGGAILAVGDARAEIGRIAASDPFPVRRMCAYRIEEFLATKTSQELAAHPRWRAGRGLLYRCSSPSGPMAAGDAGRGTA